MGKGLSGELSCPCDRSCYVMSLSPVFSENSPYTFPLVLFQMNSWYLWSGQVTNFTEEYLLWHWFGKVGYCNKPGPEVIKKNSCSAQLSMKFQCS